MRWECKPKSCYNKIKKRFAFLPTVIDNKWVWLESYYAIFEDYGIAIADIKFLTYGAAKEFAEEYYG